jgi:hypothetical protein
MTTYDTSVCTGGSSYSTSDLEFWNAINSVGRLDHLPYPRRAIEEYEDYPSASNDDYSYGVISEFDWVDEKFFCVLDGAYDAFRYAVLSLNV